MSRDILGLTREELIKKFPIENIYGDCYEVGKHSMLQI